MQRPGQLICLSLRALADRAASVTVFHSFWLTRKRLALCAAIILQLTDSARQKSTLKMPRFQATLCLVRKVQALA